MEWYGLTPTQWGLMLDAVGFLIVFVFGGFSVGGKDLIAGKEDTSVLAAKIIGGTMVLSGFVLQFYGASLP